MSQVYEDSKVVAAAAADFSAEDEGKVVILSAADGTGTATIGQPDGTQLYGVLLSVADEGEDVVCAMPNHNGIIELRCAGATTDGDALAMTVSTDGEFYPADAGDTVFAALLEPCAEDDALANGYLCCPFTIPEEEES